MKVLLTFTGFHDPFAASAATGEMRAGPVLTVVAERSFDRVCLFSTPKTPEIGEQTAISISSGTPHMHACWLLLAASGEIPATILQSTPPEFVPEGKSLVREIDIHQKDFPIITRPVNAPEVAEDDGASFMAACRELRIVREDPAFRKALHEAFIYSQYDDFHVLLLAETGSGKEHFAQFIHHLRPGSGSPMVTLNYGSIPENLVVSQLFGHKKGAFTGDASDHEGKFKSADRGVLHVDKIGELPLPAHAKLLRALDQGQIEPVGSNKPVKVNVRVIAATHRNLREMVQT